VTVSVAAGTHERFPIVGVRRVCGRRHRLSHEIVGGFSSIPVKIAEDGTLLVTHELTQAHRNIKAELGGATFAKLKIAARER
jgi:hypothetical protein